MFSSKTLVAKLAKAVPTALTAPLRPATARPRRALASSLMSRRSITFAVKAAQGEAVQISANRGDKLIDLCVGANLPIEAACGGEVCCSTCHLYIPEDLMDVLNGADEDEMDILDLAPAVKDNSRLSCQLKVSEAFEGKTFHLPAEVHSQM